MRDFAEIVLRQLFSRVKIPNRTYSPPSRPLQKKELAAIVPYFNPGKCPDRRRNYTRFIENFKTYSSRVPLITVEAAIGNDDFEIPKDRNVIQVRSQDWIWHKESLINIGTKRLIADGFENIAWLDADIEFTDPYWPERAAELLSQEDRNLNLIQLFSESVRLEANGGQTVRLSVAKDYYTRKRLRLRWRSSGYAWAIKASVLSRCPLFPYSVLGGGDAGIWLAAHYEEPLTPWLRQVRRTKFFRQMGANFRITYLNWAKCFGKIIQSRVGYLEQSVRSYPHGLMSKRKYHSRYKGFKDFNPETELFLTENGLLEWRDPNGTHAQLSIKYLKDRR